jgi:hypothetical protein
MQLKSYLASKGFNSCFQNESAACSCLDCEASCPGAGGLSPLPYEPDEEFEIAGFYGLGFIMCIVYLVLAVVFVLLLLIFRKTKCEFFVDVMATTNQMYLLGQGPERRGPHACLFLITDYGLAKHGYFLS